MPRKLQYDKSFGLDPNQIVAWKRIPTHQGLTSLPKEDWDLELYTSGNTIIVEKSALGEENFNKLLQLLVDEFSPGFL